MLEGGSGSGGGEGGSGDIAEGPPEAEGPPASSPAADGGGLGGGPGKCCGKDIADERGPGADGGGLGGGPGKPTMGGAEGSMEEAAGKAFCRKSAEAGASASALATEGVPSKSGAAEEGPSPACVLNAFACLVDRTDPGQVAGPESAAAADAPRASLRPDFDDRSGFGGTTVYAVQPRSLSLPESSTATPVVANSAKGAGVGRCTGTKSTPKS
jgi:hypothetical protein